MGAKWLRVDFAWAFVERREGTYDWSALDGVVREANSRHLKILALAAYSPEWARPAHTTDKTPPTDPSRYAAFVRAAAARYSPLDVHHWEIWNEANVAVFWQPRPSVAAYLGLLCQAYAAIHTIDPNATVISSGLAPATDNYNGSEIAPGTFLRQIYDLSGGLWFDAVGVHANSYPYRPSYQVPWNTFRQVPKLYRIMRESGDGSKKVWLTESGWATGSAPRAVTPTQQREYLVEQYELWARWPWAGPNFTYTMRDMGTNPKDLNQNFGLLRYNYSPKPSWSAYRAEMALPYRW